MVLMCYFSLQILLFKEPGNTFHSEDRDKKFGLSLCPDWVLTVSDN